MSVDAYSWTWEQILRAVVMAGRPDRLYDLQRQWHKAMQRLDVVSKALRTVRSQVDDHKWSGPGAEAYRKHYDQMIKSIDKVYSDASSMIDIAEQLAVNLAAAINEIPCPNVHDVQNLGVQHIGVTEANDHGGSSQYSSYQQVPARYHGTGIYDYVKSQFHQTEAGKRAWNHYYEKATKSWYKHNTELAQNSFASLVATYQDCLYSIPDLSRDDLNLHPTYSPSDSDDTSGGTAGSEIPEYDTGGSNFGSTPAGYASGGSAALRGNSAGSSQWPDNSSSYDSDPYNSSGKNSGTSLAGSSPSSVSGSPGTYGAAGWGGYGDSSATGSGATSGYGSSSGASPVDSANYGQSGLPAGGAEAVEAQRGNTYGAIPSGSGRGSKDKETRQTWLIEDEDFFAVENPGPPPIIDQNYMDELDERDRRRRDGWW